MPHRRSVPQNSSKNTRTPASAFRPKLRQCKRFSRGWEKLKGKMEQKETKIWFILRACVCKCATSEATHGILDIHTILCFQSSHLYHFRYPFDQPPSSSAERVGGREPQGSEKIISLHLSFKLEVFCILSPQFTFTRLGFFFFKGNVRKKWAELLSNYWRYW